MMKKAIIILCLSAMVFACDSQNTTEQTDEKVDYVSLVSEQFKGDIAFNTTAYVEQYWRVVGNAGFDSSIYKVVEGLEAAGYVLEENAADKDMLTYRVEKRALDKATWEPVGATVNIEGEEEPLLEFSSNRNMIAMNSHSADLKAEVVYVDDVSKIGDMNVEGKIVLAETHPYRLYKPAIVEGGAAGIIVYDNPDYLQPEKNTTSIQFRKIPKDDLKAWGIVLSYEAKERLKNKLSEGTVELNVSIETKIYKSEELTVVADVKGDESPNERLVFSAHVQEPGANDNATGVGVALEMATITANLVKEGKISPDRTLTFLWGDEIVSTRRYVNEDTDRQGDIKWGISLDMVGENTAITGGSFLIEKMPDPSAIWTRGKDEHTEWGATEMTLDDMQPHYLNDFVTNRFLEQGKRANWKVKTNPFEGGSDHVPFLKADIPGVLFWHFTDQFYHTDNDRLDKVSKATLRNVGTAALVSAYTLVNAGEATARQVIEEVKSAGVQRLSDELAEGQKALAKGDSLETQLEIIDAWEDWYLKALATTTDMVSDEQTISTAIEKAQKAIKDKAASCISALKEE